MKRSSSTTTSASITHDGGNSASAEMSCSRCSRNYACWPIAKAPRILIMALLSRASSLSARLNIVRGLSEVFWIIVLRGVSRFE